MMKESSRDRSSERPDARGGENKEATGFRRQRRRGCSFCSDETLAIDYKDPQSLKYFVTERGKIVPRRISGACAKHQRSIQLAVKRARNIALLPFTSND
ncbi:MAG TPA: 30S ribosomal protein S18 [Polyangiaceae bacterium]